MQRHVILILVALLLNGGFLLKAQTEEKAKNPRIVLLLDGSSSMLHEWTKDKIRFEAAGKIIDRLMDSVYAVNKDVEFALRVYGHQSPTVANNCFDSKLEVMFSKDNYTQMMLRLAALSPLGISPIAYSIQQAAEKDMTNLQDNKYSLILITDGGESCNGDICKIAEILLRKKIDFKPYIISLTDYAPLKAQYECLGEYLLLTKPEEIEPVVGKIVESYRHSFIQSTTITQLIEVSRKTPSVLKIRTPEVKINIPTPEQPLPETNAPEVPKPQPVIKKETPIVIPKPEPKKDTVVIKTPEVKPVAPPKTETPPVKPSNIVVVNEVKERKKEPSFLLPVGRKSYFPVMYVSRNPEKVRLPKVIMPAFEVEERPKEVTYKPMATATPPKVPVKAPEPPAPMPTEIKITTEEAAETTLEIYFTNGKGKYYQTTPEIVLRDIKTNKEVNRFYRDVDFAGKPRPQKGIAPGVYNMSITGKDGVLYKGVNVRANSKNKYEIIVTQGSLAFTYNANPSRPVTEFNARVSVALKRNAINKQLCTEILPYEPETYHIEINTNPISHRNIDLDFGVVMYVSLEEPGQVKIINNRGYRKVEFYYLLGDKYDDFVPTNVKGDINQQEFLIQPGRYKIAYIKDASVPNPQPIVKNFIIKSNTVTELILD